MKTLKLVNFIKVSCKQSIHSNVYSILGNFGVDGKSLSFIKQSGLQQHNSITLSNCLPVNEKDCGKIKYKTTKHRLK